MNHSIVIIDDEQDFLDSTKRCLLQAGIKNVRLNSDPRDAVDAVCNGEVFDLALIDINMPELDGKHVLKTIKEKTPYTVCVMITGVSDVKSAVDCMKLGAADYVQKPFTPEQFLAVITPILQKTRPGVPDKLRVLVVEDNQTTQQLYERRLANKIFDTKFAEDGEKGFELYQDWKPDILLLDLVLPHKSGYVLLKQIRQTDESITVIVISALGSKEDIVDCADLGIQGYFIKPVNISQLNDNILDCYAKTNEEKAKVAVIFKQRLLD
jgi:DNA-binding response OmpR family regulator